MLLSCGGGQAEGGPDPCTSSPCENDAACVPAGKDYVCLCQPGYAGERCEVDVDDCAPNPCFNGGTCTDGVDGFTCTCATGFSGVQCEQNIDDCSDAPCENGGQCIDGIDGYACACAPGYAGARCEVDVDDCDPNPCFNGGTCTDRVDGFTCGCLAGWWGRQCETSMEVLQLTTPSPLANAVVGREYAALLTRTGGSPNALWSIAPGGTNASWLTLDPMTGVLSGTPSDADLGSVSVTVRVQEPLFPENAAEQTYTFDVLALPPPAYATSFEGCPDGWTLTGDWQCGVPANVGPASAFQGTSCLGTVVDGHYSDLQTWQSATATSPEIQLLGTLPATLTFRMWVDTEGATYDGANLKISADGGTNYETLTSVVPAYALSIAGQPAWGGHAAGLEWQLVEADLSAYAGETVRLQLGFQSDSSGQFGGVYIDDVLVSY